MASEIEVKEEVLPALFLDVVGIRTGGAAMALCLSLKGRGKERMKPSQGKRRKAINSISTNGNVPSEIVLSAFSLQAIHD